MASRTQQRRGVSGPLLPAATRRPALGVVLTAVLVTAALLLPAGATRGSSLPPYPVAAPSHPLAGAATVPPPAAGWSWPLEPAPGVVRGFVAPASPWGQGHRGVDLTAASGQRVLAPADGVVAFTGQVAGRGVVAVAHPGGLRTSLEPVAAVVPTGTPVARGDVVAVVLPQTSHCAPALCLHWGVRRDGAYIDPLGLLAPLGPAVLLPVHTPAARVGPGAGRGITTPRPACPAAGAPPWCAPGRSGTR